jgi:hypothetical protein
MDSARRTPVGHTLPAMHDRIRVERLASALPVPGRDRRLGSTSGIRVVVGSWAESPFGAFADVMLAGADGTRRLLAPPQGGELRRGHLRLRRRRRRPLADVVPDPGFGFGSTPRRPSVTSVVTTVTHHP